MSITRDEIAAAVTGFGRAPVSVPPGSRRAAVCLLIVADEGSEQGQQSVVLTLRAATLRSHGGQWSLPGGRLDPGEDEVEAVLREVHEELGVELSPDAVLGRLDDFVTRSGYVMTPVVIWHADVEFRPDPNPAEVASVHTVPLPELGLEPQFLSIEESDRPVIQMSLLGTLLHAPTAAVLHQLGELLVHGRTTRVHELEQPVFAWR